MRACVLQPLLQQERGFWGFEELRFGTREASPLQKGLGLRSVEVLEGFLSGQCKKPVDLCG